MFNRTIEWKVFAKIVEQHVDEYTVPQYGDAPNDQIEDWTTKETVRAISKRCSRHGSNSREDQDALDLLKIAHEACLAYFKLVNRRPYEEALPINKGYIVMQGERGEGGSVKLFTRSLNKAQEKVEEIKNSSYFYLDTDQVWIQEVIIDEEI